MPLTNVIDDAIAVATRVKETVADADPDALVPPQIVAYRGTKPVALIVFLEGFQDVTMVRGFALAAWGFDADALALMAEAETDDEPSLILITAANRAGDVRAAHLGYVVREGSVTWSASEIFEPDDAAIARVMRDWMELPSSTASVPSLSDRRGDRDNWAADELERSCGCHVRLLESQRRTSLTSRPPTG